MTTLDGSASHSGKSKSKRKDGGSNLLGQQYIYYDDCINENLATNVYNKLQNVSDEVRRKETYLAISNNLRTAANNEYTKESALLREKFNIDLQLSEESDYTELIEAINAVLGLQNIYKRNVARIQAGQAKIDISSLFAEYYDSAWKRAFKNNWVTADAVKQAISSGNDALLKQALSALVDTVFNRAMEDMLKSNTFKGQEDDRKAYQELLDVKNKFYKSGAYGKRIADLYNIDEMADRMLQTIKEQTDLEKQIKASKNKMGSLVKADGNNKRVGELKEYFLTLTVNEVADAIQRANPGSNSIQWQAIQVGQHGVKPDVVLSYGINTNIVESAMDSLKFGSGREDFEKMFRELGQKVANFSDGFLVYTNAKSYTLQRHPDEKDNYKFSGFDGGEGGNMKFLQHLYETQGGAHAEQFIGAVMNTVQGAMGHFLKGDFENIIAEQLAWFLFDDYDTLGSELQEHSGNIIHIFDLDGVIVPLSILLRRLADSFEDNIELAIRGNNIDSVARVKISAPRNIILYRRGGEQGMGQWTAQDWATQRSYGLQNIHIATTFFRDFISLINSLPDYNKS